METLYRKVAVSERLPKINGNYLTDKYRSFYFSQEVNKFMDDEGDFIYPKYWLEPIPDPTAQLQADKSELLEALEIFIEQNTPTFTSHDYEFPEYVMKAKSLIQKHKQ